MQIPKTGHRAAYRPDGDWPNRYQLLAIILNVAGMNVAARDRHRLLSPVRRSTY